MAVFRKNKSLVQCVIFIIAGIIVGIAIAVSFISISTSAHAGSLSVAQPVVPLPWSYPLLACGYG